MYETESERVPTAGQKKKAPAQVAGQQKQSLLQSRLRMTSTQPVGGSLAGANATGQQNKSTAAMQRAKTDANFTSVDNRKSAVRASQPAPEQPSFKPETNKKRTKLTSQREPIFSSARYQKEIETRNQKL